MDVPALEMRDESRLDLGVAFGEVGGDPYVRRHLIGLQGSWRRSEVFGVAWSVSYAPDFGEADYTPLAQQLIHENRVSPDIAKLNSRASFAFEFTPISGELGNSAPFDVHAAFGGGVVHTTEDCCDANVRVQFLPTLDVGAGARVGLAANTWLGLDLVWVQYVELIGETTLEKTDRVVASASLSRSFFLRRRRLAQG